MMKFFCSILLLISVASHVSAENQGSLDKALEKSMAGMRAQAKRISYATQNLASADVTGLNPGDKPYTRQVLYFKNKKDASGNDIVRVERVDSDKSPYKKKYEPMHPAADSEGYVLYPNVDRFIEMKDIEEARTSYEANQGAFRVVDNMRLKTIDLLK